MKPFSGSISRQIPPWPVFAWAVSIVPTSSIRVLPVKPITGTTDHLRKPARECKYIFSLCYCITWSYPPIAKSFKWKTCYPNLRPLLNSQSDFSIMILGFWFGIWANGFLLPPYIISVTWLSLKAYANDVIQLLVTWPNEKIHSVSFSCYIILSASILEDSNFERRNRTSEIDSISF